MDQIIRPRAFQFSLADLLGLITLTAVAAALAAARGPESLVLSGGLIISIASWRGCFKAVQSRRYQIAMLLAAWGLFLVSLFLPCMGPPGMVYGWAAAYWSAILAWMALGNREALPFDALWFLSFCFANLLIVLLPVLAWRIRRGGGRVFAAILCVAMVSPWSIAWNAEMQFGYYVWCVSFLVALIALPMRAGTLAAMLLMAALIVGLIETGQTGLGEQRRRDQLRTNDASRRAVIGQMASTWSPRQAYSRS
jgi:hypothetical protein